MTNLSHIKRINENGVQLLIRNVSSLGQCLTNISFLDKTAKASAGGLLRTLGYFKLMELGAGELIEYVERTPTEFGYEEFRVLLDCICVEELNGEKVDGDRVFEDGYEESLQRLKDHFIKIKLKFRSFGALFPLFNYISFLYNRL
jgi:hypothetical protein